MSASRVDRAAQTPNKPANVPFKNLTTFIIDTINNKSRNRTDSCPIQSQHFTCLPKLMKNSTLGCPCTREHHQSVMLRASRELFCDEVLFTSFGASSASPQPPSSTTSLADFLHFQERLVATSTEQMLDFPPLKRS